MSDDLVKRLRDWEFVYPEEDNDPEGSLYIKAADRIEELEAANELLNEQLASIEEHGTESLNALPDCLMKLAPALVRIEELEAKLKLLSSNADIRMPNIKSRGSSDG